MMSAQNENADPCTGNGAVKKTKMIDDKQRKNEEFTLHVSLNRVVAVDSVKLSSLEKSMDVDSIQNEASSISTSIEDSDWKVQIEGYKKFRAMVVLVSKSGDSEAMSQLVRACSSFPSKIVKSTSSGAIRATAVLEACACISAFVELGQPKVDKTTFENLLQLCMVKDKAVVWKAAVATVETVIEFAAPNSCDTMARLLLQHLMSPKDSKNKKKTKKKGKRNNMTSHARCLWIQFITSALRHWNEDWDGKKWCNVRSVQMNHLYSLVSSTSLRTLHTSLQCYKNSNTGTRASRLDTAVVGINCDENSARHGKEHSKENDRTREHDSTQVSSFGVSNHAKCTLEFQVEERVKQDTLRTKQKQDKIDNGSKESCDHDIKKTCKSSQ